MLTEVVNALVFRRRRTLGDPPDIVASALRELRGGHVALTRDAELLDAAAVIAERELHPVYDCLYLALARRHEATLATFDRRLMGLAAHLGVPVWEPPAP
jgi:predicted nucleic acid-binding protein